MAWFSRITAVTLLSAVAAATTGTATQVPSGRSWRAVRYYIKSSGSTTATVDIQVSYDGTNYAAAITQVANPGTGVTTGVINGPFKYIRAVSAGATHGTISVVLEPLLEP